MSAALGCARYRWPERGRLCANQDCATGFIHTARVISGSATSMADEGTACFATFGGARSFVISLQVRCGTLAPRRLNAVPAERRPLAPLKVSGYVGDSK